MSNDRDDGGPWWRQSLSAIDKGTLRKTPDEVKAMSTDELTTWCNDLAHIADEIEQTINDSDAQLYDPMSTFTI
jgi:hypothetical protein